MSVAVDKKQKFSISTYTNNLNNKSNSFNCDILYEFDAPKYFDFETEKEITLDEIVKIDPWFLEDHMQKEYKLQRISMKKKHSLFQKENSSLMQQASSNDTGMNIKKEISLISKIKEEIPHSKALKKMIIKPVTSVPKKEGSKKGYKPNLSISAKFQQITKLKRGVSTDTYTYYACKDALKEINNGDNNSKKLTKIKLKYCPRIHNDKIMKHWESVKGKKWYALSPNSRQQANDEMVQMIKNNEI